MRREGGIGVAANYGVMVTDALPRIQWLIRRLPFDTASIVHRVGAFYDAPTADMKRRAGDSTDRGIRLSSHARVLQAVLGTLDV